MLSVYYKRYRYGTYLLFYQNNGLDFKRLSKEYCSPDPGKDSKFEDKKKIYYNRIRPEKNSVAPNTGSLSQIELRCYVPADRNVLQSQEAELHSYLWRACIF